MSWTELTGAEIRSYRSEVESDQFGMSVGRVLVPLGISHTMDSTMEHVDRLAADLTILRYPAHHADWVASITLSHKVDIVVQTDTLLYWVFEIDQAEASARSTETDMTKHPLKPDDVATAIREIFGSYSNHYTANPLLAHRTATDAYSDWGLRHFLQGDPVALIRRQDRIAAIATFVIEAGQHAEVLLAGVAPDFREQGIYGELLRQLITQVKEVGERSIAISTQVHNIGVQRSWARFGFLPVTAFNTVHIIKRRTVNSLATHGVD